MLIRSIRLRNLLSFGPEAEAIELQPLNVIIGPNASGKSNLIEALHLLRSCATDLAQPIREGGGIGEYLWKGSQTPEPAEINVEFDHGDNGLRHVLNLAEVGQRLELSYESVEEARATRMDARGPYFFYHLEDARAVLNFPEDKPAGNGHQKSKKRELKVVDLIANQSIVAQRKDPVQFPEITFLNQIYRRFHLFREWQFGRNHASRRPQQVDLPEDFLLEDASNLGLVLNDLEHRGLQPRLKEIFRTLHEDFDDYSLRIHGGTIQLYLHDRYLKRPIPATRLSDGTLRFLCLVAVLLHPEPPPLICLEEPEIALHPDLLIELARLLEDASTRTQVIVTTHSKELVDAFTETPDHVLVADKKNGSTRFERLAQDHLKQWLERYSLGELWERGQLGGNRF